MEDSHIVGWYDVWEEEDNVFFDNDIMCVVFSMMLQTRCFKKNYDAYEGAS